MVTGAEMRLANYHRPIFRPRSGQVYVCVRSVRLASNDVRPAGTEFRLGDLRAHHLRSLYTRRLIGIKDTEWTRYMLDHWENMGQEVVESETEVEIVETTTVEEEVVVEEPDSEDEFFEDDKEEE